MAPRTLRSTLATGTKKNKKTDRQTDRQTERWKEKIEHGNPTQLATTSSKSTLDPTLPDLPFSFSLFLFLFLFSLSCSCSCSSSCFDTLVLRHGCRLFAIQKEKKRSWLDLFFLFFVLFEQEHNNKALHMHIQGDNKMDDGSVRDVLFIAHPIGMVYRETMGTWSNYDQ